MARLNKAASKFRTLPEATARVNCKAATTAMKAGAIGASIPYDPRRRGVTRLLIRMAFSSTVFLHKDGTTVPHFPAAGSRGTDWSRRFRGVHVVIAPDTLAER